MNWRKSSILKNPGSNNLSHPIKTGGSQNCWRTISAKAISIRRMTTSRSSAHGIPTITKDSFDLHNLYSSLMHWQLKTSISWVKKNDLREIGITPVLLVEDRVSNSLVKIGLWVCFHSPWQLLSTRDTWCANRSRTSPWSPRKLFTLPSRHQQPLYCIRSRSKHAYVKLCHRFWLLTILFNAIWVITEGRLTDAFILSWHCNK